MYRFMTFLGGVEERGLCDQITNEGAAAEQEKEDGEEGNHKGNVKGEAIMINKGVIKLFLPKESDGKSFMTECELIEEV